MASDNVMAQHFLECSKCERNAEFFCRTCRKDLCEQCKEAHQGEKFCASHEIVVIQDKLQSGILEETCRNHKDQTYSLCCQQCQLPVCAECTKDAQHKKHSFVNLENAYYLLKEKHVSRISRINEILPSCQSLQQDVRADLSTRKGEIAEILSHMKSRAEKLKVVIDSVVEDMSSSLADIWKKQESELRDQDHDVTDCISNLKTVVDGFKRSANKPAEFLFYHLEHPPSKAIDVPNLKEIPLPMLSKGNNINFTKDDVIKYIGNVETRKATDERKSRDIGQVSYEAPSLNLMESAEKVKSVRVIGINDCYQIVRTPAGKFWIRDEILNLTDIDGSLLHEVGDVLDDWDICSLTREGGLMFIDSKGVICKYSLENGKKKALISIKEPWKPCSIFSSCYSGDILIGMTKNPQTPGKDLNELNAKVVRFNQSGKEIEVILYDVTGQPLYNYPRYVIENHNGDVVVSDYTQNAVIVVDHRKKPRFRYTGPQSTSDFWPRGIAVDALMNILICDYKKESVHLIDKDGQFLRMLLTVKNKIDEPSCLTCVPADHLLWVGCRDSKRIVAFRYLEAPTK